MTTSHITPSVRKTAPPGLLWGLRILALIATGLSFYLLYESISHRNQPAGCGPGSPCQQVLTSRWSKWFSIPVSGPAAAVYLVLLGSTIALGSRFRPAMQRMGWRLLALTSLTALGAGSWFTALQYVKLHSFCPWCLSIHICALIIVVLMLAAWSMAGRRSMAEDSSDDTRPRHLSPSIAGAVLLLGLLVAGQLRAPPPHNTVLLAEGKLNLDPNDFPLLGSADAPHLLIIMGDYTCPHCRRTHPLLERARERYGAQIAMISLMVPINADCNPAIQVTEPANVHACELAKVALTVWRANPAAFDAMDRWLFESPEPRIPNAARQHAVELVGEGAYRDAESDPLVEQTLKRCVSIYAQLDAGPVPKVILPHSIISGEIEDEKAMDELIEKELNIKPVQ